MTSFLVPFIGGMGSVEKHLKSRQASEKPFCPYGCRSQAGQVARSRTRKREEEAAGWKYCRDFQFLFGRSSYAALVCVPAAEVCQQSVLCIEHSLHSSVN